jgi:hypothetical protein
LTGKWTNGQTERKMERQTGRRTDKENKKCDELDKNWKLLNYVQKEWNLKRLLHKRTDGQKLISLTKPNRPIGVKTDKEMELKTRVCLPGSFLVKQRNETELTGNGNGGAFCFFQFYCSEEWARNGWVGFVWFRLVCSSFFFVNQLQSRCVIQQIAEENTTLWLWFNYREKEFTLLKKKLFLFVDIK